MMRGLRRCIRCGRLLIWRLLCLTGRGGSDQNASSMIGGSSERGPSDCSELTGCLSLSSSMKSTSSSSKSGLSLAIPAKTRNAINENKQNAPYTSNTSATIYYLASLAARPINKMTGFEWAYYSTKDMNVIQQRWGGVCIRLHNSVIVPHE